jgi:CDP-paratose 2-epimerase
VELHGFLSYLIKCNVEERPYKIFGYKGKQVRDNIHSRDVVSFMERFIAQPRQGEVYNLGGGRGNALSILEAFDLIAAISGKKMRQEYVDKNRAGDHICYISDLSKMKAHYPGWEITTNLPAIFEEIYRAWLGRAAGQTNR